MNITIKVTPLKDWAIIDYETGDVICLESTETNATDKVDDLELLTGFEYLLILSSQLLPSQITQCMNDMKLSCEFRYELV